MSLSEFQRLLDLREDLINLIGATVSLAVVSVIWLSGLSIFAARHHDDQKGIRRRVAAVEARLDPPVAPESRRTVKSAVEEGIHEMASIEKWRQELIAIHGNLPVEMEELFAAYRTQVKNRRLGQLDRELAEMMGMEAVR